MTPEHLVDVPRLIRIVTAACAIAAGALVYLRFEPDVQSVSAEADDARAELRSDDVVIAEMPRLRGERDALRRRYDRLFAQDPEALFLRDLDADARRHDVAVVSTSTLAGSAAGAGEPPASRGERGERGDSPFPQISLTLELRGAYRALLETVGDLSRGSEIVSVGQPSLRRDGAALVASVPITIYEPQAIR